MTCEYLNRVKQFATAPSIIEGTSKSNYDAVDQFRSQLNLGLS